MTAQQPALWGPDGTAHATRLVQPLVGGSLDQLCVGGWEVQLHFSTGHGVQLEQPVDMGPSVGVRAHALEGLALLVPLLNAQVDAVAVDVPGDLVLTIGGTTLRCPAPQEFEAWNLSGPDGLRIISTPGGLAIWVN